MLKKIAVVKEIRDEDSDNCFDFERNYWIRRSY